MISMKRRHVSTLVLGVSCVGLWLAMAEPSSSQSSVYTRMDFNSSSYNAAYSYPEDGWHADHLPTGGWNGTGGAHVVMHAGATQYNFGWVTQGLGRSFAIGDSVYIRFRIKYDENMRASTAWGNKFIMMGNTGTSPNSRIIVYMNPPHDSRGCTLGFTQNGSNPAWAVPSYYGISVSGNSFFNSNVQSMVWSLAPHVNIGWECAPPVLQTVPSNPLGARPGSSGSAAASNGWYHIQIYAQSGGPGQGAFKTWANNNNGGAPTSQQIGLPNGLGVNGWQNGASFGGYMDNNTPTTNLGYTIDDFEIGGTFDSSWYPGGGGTPPPPTPTAPTAPTNVRIVSGD
jgi:hypothetical protein